ncbi:MAG TPA: hypothetical protein PLS49_06810 [Candidatus Woesebacteria bacterium]|nr:hypothetical protein [Candidatus Woesebacteria bacterium]
MKINISKVLSIYFLFSACIFPQDDSNFLRENENKLSRSRILFGYSSVIQHKEEPNLKNIFINVNHRFSNFNSFTKPFRVKWAFEVGVNGLNIKDEDIDGVAIIPYVKTGPEMSLSKNLFIGGSFGIAASVLSYFAIFPYAGVNTYYLLPVDDNIFLEFEVGYHTTFFLEKTPYLIYFSTGVAIK